MTTLERPIIKNRDLTLDLMWVVALVMIVWFHHMPGYYFNFYDLRNLGVSIHFRFIGHLMRYFGLGSFIFYTVIHIIRCPGSKRQNYETTFRANWSESIV